MSRQLWNRLGAGLLCLGLLLGAGACGSSGATVESNQTPEDDDSTADVHILIPHKQAYDGGDAKDWTRRRHRPEVIPIRPIGPPPPLPEGF